MNSVRTCKHRMNDLHTAFVLYLIFSFRIYCLAERRNKHEYVREEILHKYQEYFGLAITLAFFVGCGFTIATGAFIINVIKRKRRGKSIAKTRETGPPTFRPTLQNGITETRFDGRGDEDLSRETKTNRSLQQRNTSNDISQDFTDFPHNESKPTPHLPPRNKFSFESHHLSNTSDRFENTNFNNTKKGSQLSLNVSHNRSPCSSRSHHSKHGDDITQTAPILPAKTKYAYEYESSDEESLHDVKICSPFIEKKNVTRYCEEQTDHFNDVRNFVPPLPTKNMYEFGGNEGYLNDTKKCVPPLPTKEMLESDDDLADYMNDVKKCVPPVPTKDMLESDDDLADYMNDVKKCVPPVPSKDILESDDDLADYVNDVKKCVPPVPTKEMLESDDDLADYMNDVKKCVPPVPTKDMLESDEDLTDYTKCVPPVPAKCYSVNEDTNGLTHNFNNVTKPVPHFPVKNQSSAGFRAPDANICNSQRSVNHNDNHMQVPVKRYDSSEGDSSEEDTELADYVNHVESKRRHNSSEDTLKSNHVDNSSESSCDDLPDYMNSLPKQGYPPKKCNDPLIPIPQRSPKPAGTKLKRKSTSEIHCNI